MDYWNGFYTAQAQHTNDLKKRQLRAVRAFFGRAKPIWGRDSHLEDCRKIQDHRYRKRLRQCMRSMKQYGWDAKTPEALPYMPHVSLSMIERPLEDAQRANSRLAAENLRKRQLRAIRLVFGKLSTKTRESTVVRKAITKEEHRQIKRDESNRYKERLQTYKRTMIEGGWDPKRPERLPESLCMRERGGSTP